MHLHETAALALLALGPALGCSGQPVQASARHEPSEAREAPLQPGVRAPEVTVTLQDGFALTLSAMKGKPIALFFCSNIANPECAREAVGLRDHWEELHESHHLVLIGVSPQDAAAQRAFIAEHALRYDFASDPDGKVAQAFKVPVRSDSSVHAILIDRDGTMRSTWQSADPELHAREILAAIGGRAQ